MRYLLPLIFMLSACSTAVPIVAKFPDAPAELMAPAPELTPLLPDTTELSVMIDNANENYGSYRELRVRYEMWQEWYREQRKNWETIKNKEPK